MIITLSPTAPETTATAMLEAAMELGLGARTMPDGNGGAIVGIDGMLPGSLLALPGVIGVHERHKPYMLASREHRATSVVDVGGVPVGGATPVIMAGPCVIEGLEETIEAAIAVKEAGAQILRGGAFKPRSSPYAFQGLGEEGLRFLAEARDVTGLPVVTEVLEPEQVGMVAAYADLLQIGARNMANFPLLKRVGAAGKPVLLKRGFSATIEEWLMSAEYIMAHGNYGVILCERGIRSFDTSTRFTLDLNAVPVAKELSHLPVIVDPSHGTGRRNLVPRMSLAGIAAGADGLIIEAHPSPDTAMCDASQTITPETLADIIRKSPAIHALTAETLEVPELALMH